MLDVFVTKHVPHIILRTIAYGLGFLHVVRPNHAVLSRKTCLPFKQGPGYFFLCLCTHIAHILLYTLAALRMMLKDRRSLGDILPRNCKGLSRSERMSEKCDDPLYSNVAL